MRVRRLDYPFVPKSTAYLQPGQFWSIPLSNGSFACGRVIQLKSNGGKKRDPRLFLAGLMDWVGPVPPSRDALIGARVLEQGEVHIRTILAAGGQILGIRDLAAEKIEPWFFLSQWVSVGARVQRGLEVIGLADAEQSATLAVQSTWGFRVMTIRAEGYFVEGTKDRKAAGSSESTRQPMPGLEAMNELVNDLLSRGEEL